ncbi:hypothetical protein CDES_12980 [Corynebacterium deserti GIMN1.010]|uniref:Phosphatidic acid phosphatase type 2/haloperoxidase domain-containing protein n=1 Tax=Corynebacterium deserti GIMN1.010 TaxID=931089 RepID=A0A0M4CI31_9CORY|nr:hypothetical protein [Corynebacterium deserti]ALC06940.1 hypothetical protein CDES_12980 [Corynebacterium deserti GIMN1.010]
MNSHVIARAISEICAPWILNIAFFLILSAVTGTWGPGLVAAVGTGVIPMVLIMSMIKAGKLGDHHVTSRGQRGAVFAGVIVCVIVLLLVFTFLDAPRIMWAGVSSALVFLMVFGLITRKIKASVHVGLWVCQVTFLGLTVSSWWLLGLLFTPVTAWARIRIKHHTMAELWAGVAAGAVATGLSYLLFLS